MILDSDVLWYAGTNTWVVAPAPGGPAIIVDAPPDPDGIVALLARHDLVPAALLITHGHVDHVGGAGGVQARTGVIGYVHPADDFLTLDPGLQLRALFGMGPAADLSPPRELAPIADGDVLELAGIRIEVRHTPGHTPGHCCFLLPDEGWLFAGDQLFAGSVGRTDLPGGSFDSLLESMRTRVLDLADDVRVLPGHGPETSIGRERRTNPFLADLRR